MLIMLCTDLDLPFKEILNSATSSIASVIQIEVTVVQENLGRPSFRTTQKFRTDILHLSCICTRNWVLFFKSWTAKGKVKIFKGV